MIRAVNWANHFSCEKHDLRKKGIIKSKPKYIVSFEYFQRKLLFGHELLKEFLISRGSLWEQNLIIFFKRSFVYLKGIKKQLTMQLAHGVNGLCSAGMSTKTVFE